MWSTLSNQPEERKAFFSLLDEYFSQSPSSTSTPQPYQSAHKSTSTLTPIAPSPSFSARANTASTSLSTSLASSVLKNPSLSTAAFKQAGLSSSQANAASKFGAQNSEVLAPHLGKAGVGMVKSGWNNKGEIGNAAMGRPGVKVGGKPEGLTSSSGVWNAMKSTKGPMSKEEARKNVFSDQLATRTPIKAYAPPSTSSNLPPPPVRTVIPVVKDGLGSARALYDYEGTEADDLPLSEGNEVTIIQHVSVDWVKCRNNQGQEGLVPTAYIQQL